MFPKYDIKHRNSNFNRDEAHDAELWLWASHSEHRNADIIHLIKSARGWLRLLFLNNEPSSRNEDCCWRSQLGWWVFGRVCSVPTATRVTDNNGGLSGSHRSQTATHRHTLHVQYLYMYTCRCMRACGCISVWNGRASARALLLRYSSRTYILEGWKLHAMLLVQFSRFDSIRAGSTRLDSTRLDSRAQLMRARKLPCKSKAA